MVPFSWMSPSLLNAMWIVNVGLMFHEAYRLIVSMKFFIQLGTTCSILPKIFPNDGNNNNISRNLVCFLHY